MTLCTGWVRPSNTLRPSTCRKKGARFHTAIRRPKKIVQLVGCWNIKIALGTEDSVQIPLSPTSPLLRAFLISTLDGKMLILIASWQEPFVLAPRCRLFILENCSPFKYPHLIVPLDYVLALFYVFLFFFLSYETPHWQHERSKGGCNLLTADYWSVSSAHAHWPDEQRATEGLRSRDLNKRQQRQPGRSHMDEQGEQVEPMKQSAHHVSRQSNRRFLENKRDYFCPTVSFKDKLNRSQQSLQQSLVNAVSAYYLNQPSNVLSPFSFPLHIPLLTSFLISNSASFHLLCSWKHGKKHNMKYCTWMQGRNKLESDLLSS